MDQANPALPVLRREIQILPGPEDAARGATFTVHDPFLRTFDQVGAAEAMILEGLRVPRRLDDLLEELARRASLRLEREEVLAFCGGAAERGYAASSPVCGEGAASCTAPETPWWKKALKGYLSFRVPLVDPDRFLARTLPWVRPLASRPFLALLAAAALTGAVLALERAPAFAQALGQAASPSGLAAFGLCLLLLKAAHELAHAYAAKAAGLSVPAMGIVFIVLSPVAYTDVTDAWRLPDRRARLAVSGAGVAAEAAAAGVSLLCWALLDPGPARQLAFYFACVSLGSSLFINLSPFMRFDGYYLLMDLARLDNLQPRAFAMAAWCWRGAFLGMARPDPEPGLGARGKALLAAYGLGCVAYRMTLYLGIALVVYRMFFKALGLALFAVEVWWFLLLPVWREARAVRLLGGARWTWPGALLACCALGGLCWLALPMARTAAMPGAAIPSRSQTLYAPRAGELADLRLTPGAAVRQGDPLFTVRSKLLDSQIEVLRLQIALLEKTSEFHSLELLDKALMGEAEAEVQQARARLAGLTQERLQASVSAELDGEVVAPEEGLRDGLSVSARQVLGAVADFSRFSVLALADEAALTGIGPGSPAVFSPSGGGSPLTGVVAQVSPLRVRTLDEAPWASVLRQDLPVTADARGRPQLLGSHYLVRVDLHGAAEGLVLGRKGRLRIETRPRSLLAEAARDALRVLVRESGF